MRPARSNADNPNGPLEICLCIDRGAVLMLDDKQKRIRVTVPKGGRPVFSGLRPDFIWPKSAA